MVQSSSFGTFGSQVTNQVWWSKQRTYQQALIAVSNVVFFFSLDILSECGHTSRPVLHGGFEILESLLKFCCVEGVVVWLWINCYYIKYNV